MAQNSTSIPVWAFSSAAVSTLKPGPKLRRHSRDQLERLMRCIRAFGIPVPIIVDANMVVIDGHLVLKAAKKLGLHEVPVARRDHLTDEQARAMRIALNRMAELAQWDEGNLALELADLGTLDFDLGLTGFSTPEIDALLLSPAQPEECVMVPATCRPTVTRRGDSWMIGDHVISCGDAREPGVIPVKIARKAQMIFTDPPYNVPIDGNVAGIKQSRYREFAMAAGEMSPGEYRDFLEQSMSSTLALALPGAIMFMCIDWRQLQLVLEVGAAHGLELKNICVWAKTNFGMGSFYRSQTEHVVVFKVPGAEHIRNIGPGSKGRNRTNLWSYAGVNGFGTGRAEALAMHPTVKPLAMIADAIRDCSERGGIVLDPFAGSGNVLVAAHRTGRVGMGIEIDPAYVDLIVNRLEQETGEDAYRDDDTTFAKASAASTAAQAEAA